MPIAPHFRPFAYPLVVAAATCTLAGCGVDEYESLMARRLAVLRIQQKFDALAPPTKIDDFPIRIRFPNLFREENWFRKGATYFDGEPIAKERLLPAFLSDLPGYNRTGEAFGEVDPRKSLSYNCYLAVLDSRTTKVGMLEIKLQVDVRARLPNTTAWTSIECRNEQGQPVSWRRMRAKGEQNFDDRRGNNEYGAYPGTLDVYLHEGNGYIVLWAVRIPDAVDERMGLLEAAETVAATLEIDPPAVEEKPSKSPSKGNKSGK